jgi:predicted porin
MKKIISAAIVGSLLVTAAAPAMAQPCGQRDGYSRQHDNRSDNTGAMIGLGIGLFALGAIIASSQDRYQPRYAPPPPRYGYGYGPSRPAYGYGNSYGYNDGYYYGR